MKKILITAAVLATTVTLAAPATASPSHRHHVRTTVVKVAESFSAPFNDQIKVTCAGTVVGARLLSATYAPYDITTGGGSDGKGGTLPTQTLASGSGIWQQVYSGPAKDPGTSGWLLGVTQTSWSYTIGNPPLPQTVFTIKVSCER